VPAGEGGDDRCPRARDAVGGRVGAAAAVRATPPAIPAEPARERRVGREALVPDGREPEDRRGVLHPGDELDREDVGPGRGCRAAAAPGA
jgi:hypothetical protein